MTREFPKIRFCADHSISRSVKVWLLTGLIMILFQIVIGGITRLTGSGLSITRWEIVVGTIPPMSESAWENAFALYQQTPQYQKINQGMQLSAFKFIYFWEYFHRLWARLMFVVFVIPFFWFLFKGLLSRKILWRLLMVVALGALEGFFGWAMVKSGLSKRPWVNAYNLTLHLSMALIIFSYLLWTYFMAISPEEPERDSARQRRFTWWIYGLVMLQIAFGAIMSGSKAGLFYPSWPDMKGSYLPEVLLDWQHWSWASFVQYDTNPFMPALIHFLHRNTAYLLTVLVFYYVWKIWKGNSVGTRIKQGAWMVLAAVVVQVLLGIFTVINCKVQIPVDLGVAHQAGAVILLTTTLWCCYLWRRPGPISEV